MSRNKITISDWMSALRDAQARRDIPRKPGHETIDEIAERFGLSLRDARRMIATIEAAGAKVERNKVTYFRRDGQRGIKPTYRLVDNSLGR